VKAISVFFSFILIFLSLSSAKAEQIKFSDAVKASLIFEDDFKEGRQYPHILNVFLRLENIRDGDLFWMANPVEGVEAELLDAKGKPAPEPPGAESIMSNPSFLLLPYGSRLDWLISHGGIGMVGDTKNSYALMVGGKGWLIPMTEIGSYTLRIRLRGLPWTRSDETKDGKLQLLLDLPPVKLEVSVHKIGFGGEQLSIP
jgi:hypothetical protein